MVDGINFNGKIGQINGINNTQVGKLNNTPKAGLFGDGFKNNNTAGIERNVVPQHLADKFADVQIAKYNKNIPQLTIKDADYIPDGMFEEKVLCEV